MPFSCRPPGRAPRGRKRGEFKVHRRVIIKDNRQRRNRPAQSHTLLSSREPAGSLHATPYPHCGGLAQLGPPARLSCFHQPHLHVRYLAPHRPSVPHLRRCSKLLDVVKVERLGACARATIRRTVVRAGAFGACSQTAHISARLRSDASKRLDDHWDDRCLFVAQRIIVRAALATHPTTPIGMVKGAIVALASASLDS